MSSTDKQKPAEGSTSGGANADSSKAGADEAKKLPQLGALEEDDEFEEVRHTALVSVQLSSMLSLLCATVRSRGLATVSSIFQRYLESLTSTLNAQTGMNQKLLYRK